VKTCHHTFAKKHHYFKHFKHLQKINSIPSKDFRNKKNFSRQAINPLTKPMCNLECFFSIIPFEKTDIKDISTAEQVENNQLEMLIM
jgi:hypothetical protein